MRHGQQAPLRTSLTPYTGGGWSMVRSRSDIYTRPLPLYIPSEVTWFHGEIPRLKHPLSSPPPSFCLFSFFSSCCLSFYLPFRTLFICLSLSTSVCLSSFPSSTCSFLLYIIPFLPFASSSLSPSSLAGFLFAHFASGVVSSSGIRRG